MSFTPMLVFACGCMQSHAGGTSMPNCLRMAQIMFASVIQLLAIWFSSLSNFPMGLGTPA